MWYLKKLAKSSDPKPKPNLPWIFLIHIFARKRSIVRYKTTRYDKTQDQLQTKTQGMLLHNMDFKKSGFVSG